MANDLLPFPLQVAMVHSLVSRALEIYCAWGDKATANGSVLPHGAGVPVSYDSSAGSPSLTSSSFPFLAPPSESTASTRSLPLAIPSLWVQLILTRLTLSLQESNGRTSACDACPEVYILESEDNSFSLDVQGNCTNCQLKVAALEVSHCRGNCSQHGDCGFHGNQEAGHDNSLFDKILSSRHSVMTDQALRAVELFSSDLVGSSIRSTVWQNPVSPFGSFVTMEVAADTASHHPLEVKLFVQTFECVVWLPLVMCVMDTVSALLPVRGQKSGEESGSGTMVWQGECEQCLQQLGGFVSRSSLKCYFICTTICTNQNVFI